MRHLGILFVVVASAAVLSCTQPTDTDVLPLPTDFAAHETSGGTIMLTWTDNALDEVGYDVERRTEGASFAAITTLDPDASGFEDVGVEPETTYFYRLRVFRDDGASEYGGVASVTTTATSTPPVSVTAPSNLLAEVLDYSAVNLSWTDNSDNEDGFVVERRSSSESVYSVIANPGSGVTGYLDATGAGTATTYHYRVCATAGDTWSVPSEIATIMTITPPADATAYVCDELGADLSDAGGPMTPYQSISYALSQVPVKGYEAILVAEGTYTETVDLRDGVSLYGGYKPDDWAWTRDTSSNLTILMSDEAEDYTVRAMDIAETTYLDGFRIYGPVSPTASSVAVYVSDSSSALSITNNVIISGNGAPGATQYPSPNGVDGNDGDPGSDSFEAETQVPPGSNPGGVGGVTAGLSSGGEGGSADSPVEDVAADAGAEAWTAAGGAGSGYGGAGGFSGSWTGSGTVYSPANGFPGQNGGVGEDGSNGAGGVGGSAAGLVAAGHWRAGDGGNGADGQAGGGGGGGGASGGVEDTDGLTPNTWIVGASGGGGGSGGGYGTGGAGGTGGGGSFGIFVTFTTQPLTLPAISGNVIHRGQGGNGGSGGSAGVGGSGGDGAPGGILWLWGAPFTFAGSGGDGGDGGHGGGGGGGAGGMTCGIAVNRLGYSGTLDGEASNTSTGGTPGHGGAGGLSYTNPGSPGAEGAVEDVLYW